MAKRFLLLIFLLKSCYLGAENSTLTFYEIATWNDEQMTSWSGRQVTISGFLYQSPTNEWILSALPNLKSCCVGSHQKKKEQIYIEFGSPSSFSPSKRVVKIQGVFHYSSDDELLFLKQATLTPSSHF